MRIHTFDYDGTLEDEDCELSKKKSVLLDEIENRGELWTVATGKSWPGLQKMMRGRKPNAPFAIVDCGGRIVDTNGNTLHAWQVPSESFSELEEILVGAQYAIFSGLKNVFDCYYFSPDGTRAFADDKLTTTSNAAEFLSSAKKVGCAKLTIAAPNEFACIPRTAFHHRTGRYRDIIAREAGKGPALLAALNLFSNELHGLEVRVYGNGSNDIGMFRLGIALAGACTARVAIGNNPPAELAQAASHRFNTLEEAMSSLA